MRLDDAPESGNVEDRRGMGSKLAIGGGVGGTLLLVLGLIFGVDLGGGKQPGGGGGGGDGPPPDKETKVFAEKILGTLESVWQDEFAKHSREYHAAWRPPKMVLFSNQVKTGCGIAPSAVGPFYCPADEHVYLDPTFFEELDRKLGGSKAQFSQAYVVAHEVGHHVQNLLGYSARVDSQRGTSHEKEASVRLELMADYLAGVWAYHGQRKFNFLEPGDAESAIKSARAIGDDRLQRRGRRDGEVHPEAFTHGTSAQRVGFFSEGMRTGDASKARLDRFFTARFNHNTGELAE
jgi:predicted metalloprotease